MRRRRPKHPEPDPWAAPPVLVEYERGADGQPAPVAAVFLSGRECPWRCAMCDLWTHTIGGDTPRGAIPHQLDQALADIGRRSGPLPRFVKLYNASSFFDPRAVPLEDYDALAQRLGAFDHVTVESHPALIGTRVDWLLEALGRHRPKGSPPLTLEVAMGLETADEEALGRLNKGMTLELFARAAAELGRRGVALRAFLLVPPPFVAPAAEETALRRSIEFAFANGARVVSLIPTRSGNGTLEALADVGLFRPPVLADLEKAMAVALPGARGRVFADLWDLDRLAPCPGCRPGRRERLHLMNLLQVRLPAVSCARCGAGAA